MSLSRANGNDWRPMSDGVTHWPWLVIRGKPDGTAECLRTRTGMLVRFKTRETAQARADELNRPA